jgi:hypothetical protein
MPAHCVGVGEPAKEVGELAAVAGAEHKVSMVGHHAVGEDIERHALVGRSLDRGAPAQILLFQQ